MFPSPSSSKPGMFTLHNLRSAELTTRNHVPEFRLLLGLEKSPPATKSLRIAETRQEFLGIHPLPNSIDGAGLKNFDPIL